LDRTLENALVYRIEKEFPYIGGPRIRQFCAKMVLETNAENPPTSWQTSAGKRCDRWLSRRLPVPAHR